MTVRSLDDAVYRVEEDIDSASDQELEEMKAKRAKPTPEAEKH